MHRNADAAENLLREPCRGVAFNAEVSLDLFGEFLSAGDVGMMVGTPVVIDVMKNERKGQSFHVVYPLGQTMPGSTLTLAA